ncbi:hypothetical protein NP493_452g04024 [Ridgeia piscesae]|uniref:Uncharacterized protein n=1 Tax=Ridgeia piscesae TaxID=27915 RepID=A0AAD9NTM4_RIDPI|nr:hypothetical protein NP493_452g04024 [Ridgeia piscesae]
MSFAVSILTCYIRMSVQLDPDGNQSSQPRTWRTRSQTSTNKSPWPENYVTSGQPISRSRDIQQFLLSGVYNLVKLQISMLKELEEKRTALETRLTATESSCLEKEAVLQKQNIDHEAEKVRWREELKAAVDQAELAQSRLTEQFEETKKKLRTEKTETEKSLAQTKALLECRIQELAVCQESLAKTKLKDTEARVKEITLQLEQKEEHAKQVEHQLQELDSTRQERQQLEQKTRNLDELLSTATSDKLSLEAALKKLETERSDLESRLSRLETELKAATESGHSLQAQKASLEKTCEDLKNSLTGSTECNSVLDKKIQDLNAALDREKEERQKETEHLQKDKQLLEDEKTKLESDIAAHQKQIKQTRLEEEKSQLEEAKSQLEASHSQTTKAKSLLNEQKTQLEHENTRLDQQTSQLQQEKSQLEHDKTELHEAKCQLEETKTKLEEDVARLRKEKTAVEERYETEMRVLSENMNILRADVAAGQSLQAINDELVGQKLELEAKLSNNNDERKALLERCVASEEECRKLREKALEVRRKLDDTQGALQELGRENQTLQIKTSKTVGRKWADDSVVTNCHACAKLFSVTVRKV